jgi:rhodanese-related sulfurtransferase
MKAIAAGFALLCSGIATGPALADPPSATTAYHTQSSSDFAKSSSNVTLIDVRQPNEWAETGIPVTAKGVTLQRPDFVEAILAEVGGDKTKPVALICRSGNRSKTGAEQLIAAGFTNVTNIGDGMIGRAGIGEGWLAARLPTQAYTAPAR